MQTKNIIQKVAVTAAAGWCLAFATAANAIDITSAPDGTAASTVTAITYAYEPNTGTLPIGLPGSGNAVVTNAGGTNIWVDPSTVGVAAEWITPSEYYSGAAMPYNDETGIWLWTQTFNSTEVGTLSGLMLTDDAVVDIKLNGISILSGYTPGAQPPYQNASSLLGGDVLKGNNILEFRITNSGKNTTGLAYKFSVVPVVPEPGMVTFGILSGGALGGMVFRGRLRSRKAALRN
jgi:hypothetical protein